MKEALVRTARTTLDDMRVAGVCGGGRGEGRVVGTIPCSPRSQEQWDVVKAVTTFFCLFGNVCVLVQKMYPKNHVADV